MMDAAQTDSRLRAPNPDSIGLNWVTDEIEWPFHTRIERKLYYNEFHNTGDDAGAAQRVINMLNSLGSAIDKAFAGDRVGDSIKFKYWRKISPKATKFKPRELKATMFQHPDYNTPWIYIEEV